MLITTLKMKRFAAHRMQELRRRVVLEFDPQSRLYVAELGRWPEGVVAFGTSRQKAFDNLISDIVQRDKAITYDNISPDTHCDGNDKEASCGVECLGDCVPAVPAENAKDEPEVEPGGTVPAADDPR